MSRHPNGSPARKGGEGVTKYQAHVLGAGPVHATEEELTSQLAAARASGEKMADDMGMPDEFRERWLAHLDRYSALVYRRPNSGPLAMNLDEWQREWAEVEALASEIDREWLLGG